MGARVVVALALSPNAETQLRAEPGALVSRADADAESGLVGAPNSHRLRCETDGCNAGLALSSRCLFVNEPCLSSRTRGVAFSSAAVSTQDTQKQPVDRARYGHTLAQKNRMGGWTAPSHPLRTAAVT